MTDWLVANTRWNPSLADVVTLFFGSGPPLRRDLQLNFQMNQIGLNESESGKKNLWTFS